MKLAQWLYSFVILGAIISPIHAAAPATQPAFTRLKDALDFIDHELDVEDWNGLSKTLFPALQPNEPNRTSWMELKNHRGKLRLVDVYEGQEFPQSGDSYLPGANASIVFGWPRIRFIKSDGKWYINAIYGVR